jgi:hypothetical protein
MSARLYAEGTAVPVDRSKAEIERLLTRYGATAFASGWSDGSATLLFEAQGRRIRFELPLPNAKSHPNDDKRMKEARRRWRCLALVIKAKLEAVESQIVTFEEEFLAHIIVPGTKETFGTWAAPQIAAAYERGLKMPPLLGAGAVDG